MPEKPRKEKKQKSEKSKDERIKKEKKKKKERKKKRQEIIRQQQENKRGGEGEQKLNMLPPDTINMDISEKSRFKSKSNQEVNSPELIPAMPSSSEAGVYKKRAYPFHVDNEKSNDDLELLKNEITTGDLSSLYIPQNKESAKHHMKETTDLTHKIVLPSLNERTKENSKNSSTESRKENEISLPAYDITKPPPPIADNSPVTDLNHLPNVNVTMVKNEILKEIVDVTLFEFETTTETTEKGDLSCLSGTFLPAPSVDNAEIKYIRYVSLTWFFVFKYKKLHHFEFYIRMCFL